MSPEPHPLLSEQDRLDYLFGLLQRARFEQEARRRHFPSQRAPYLALIRAIEGCADLAESA